MKSKKYYIDLINHTKIIKESETLNSNGEINLYLRLSPIEYSTNKMTINDLAVEMREGFKQINQRLDEHDIILKEHSMILKEHSMILKEHSMILKEHSMILKEHSEIFTKNNLK